MPNWQPTRQSRKRSLRPCSVPKGPSESIGIYFPQGSKCQNTEDPGFLIKLIVNLVWAEYSVSEALDPLGFVDIDIDVDTDVG